MDFLLLAARSGWETLTYIFAYWGVPVWGLAAAVAVAAVDPGARWRGWFRSGAEARRLLGTLLLGAASHPWHPDWKARLRAASGRPFHLALFLGASHGLTAWFFFLVGPLLGKDVLLTHVVGIGLFVLLAGGILAFSGLPVRHGGAEATSSPLPFRRTLRSEALGVLPGLAWGLVLGSLVAAWGLGSPGFVPAEWPGSGWASQGANAVAGAGLAAVLCLPPVGNLFLATYLWKVGLAHAGLVAFLAGAPLSLFRTRAYREVLGARESRRILAALAVAAVGAGLLVALIWGAAGLEVRYKLTPAQMWSP